MKFYRFTALALVSTIAGCATPQQQYRRHSTPTVNAPTQVAPSPPPEAKDYFTIGSTMDEVAALMGTPTRVNNFLNEVWWSYSYSRITFRQGRVTEWDNSANNLKVRWSASTPTATRPPVRPPQPAPPAPQPTQSPDARQIDAQVATILAGEHSPLPPAQRVRANPTANAAEMLTRNNTQYTLTVLYSGPTSRRVVLAPQGTQRVVLGIGAYQVAATVDSPSVLPFAGRDNIGGGRYDNTFYIETVRR